MFGPGAGSDSLCGSFDRASVSSIHDPTAISSFQQWCRSIVVTDLIPPRTLVFACNDDSLLSVLRTIKQHDIHSLPVVQRKTQRVVGMIEVIDIAVGIYDMAELDRLRLHGRFDPGEVSATFIDVAPLRRKLESVRIEQFLHRGAPPSSELIQIAAASFEGPQLSTTEVYVDDTLETVLRKSGFDARRRIPIVAAVEPPRMGSSSHSTAASLPRLSPMVHHTDGELFTPPNESLTPRSVLLTRECHNALLRPLENSEILDVISQSDVLRFLCEHIDRIPESVLDIPVSNIASRTITKVDINDSLAEALHLFKNRRVQCIAVEDRIGRFLGTISARDFVKRADDLSVYGMAVFEFMGLPENDRVEAALRRRGYLSGTCDMTIGEAIQVMTKGKQARIWLMDACDEKETKSVSLYGVVTIRDIIMKLWRIFPGNDRANRFAD